MGKKEIKEVVSKVVEKAKELESLTDEVLLKKLSFGKIVIQKIRNPRNGAEFYRIHLRVTNKLKPIILIKDDIDIETIEEFTAWFNKNKDIITEIIEQLNGNVEIPREEEKEEELLA
ncbi:MAG: hypothetical protein Q9M37_03485 [Desulfonauticus sp.]|nr:hypothetical protein [Desulfonauticus sp.]